MPGENRDAGKPDQGAFTGEGFTDPIRIDAERDGAGGGGGEASEPPKRSRNGQFSGGGGAKRGPKAGGGKAAGTSLDLSAAAGLLQGIHVALAMGAGKHWLLSDDEAKYYGNALANAARHLPIVVAQKYFDFGALAVAFFVCDGTRFLTTVQLRREALARKAAPARMPGAVVYPFGDPNLNPMEH
jgi:hypothetical protein